MGSSASVRQRHFQRCFQLHKYFMDFFRLKTLKSHTNAHAVRDRPSLKDGERQFRPGSFHELQDNSNETQTNSNEAKNASDNAEMMVHVDESFNFHTRTKSYVNLSQDSCDKIELYPLSILPICDPFFIDKSSKKICYLSFRTLSIMKVFK